MIAADTTAGLVDNVEVQLYETDELTDRLPGWDAMSDRERLQELDTIEPVETITAHNLTTLDYRTHLASLLNRGVDVEPVEATHIAFGSDDTLPQDDYEGDDELGAENYRTVIDDVQQDGDVLHTITLLGADDAVGLNLLEAGLVTASEPNPAEGQDLLVNRVVLVDDDGRLEPKTTDHALRVRVDIIYRDISDNTEVST